MGIWIPGGVSDSGGGGLPEIVTWANGTDEQIVAMVQAHYDGLLDLHDYWSVGDERNSTYSTEEITFVLTEVGGKYLADENDNPTSIECAFQVDQKNCLLNTYSINTSATTQGSWRDSYRRDFINNTYYNGIPSTIRGIFKKFINYTGDSNGTSSWSGLQTTADYFALRSEVEVLGASSYYSISGEGTQIGYYTTTANQRKMRTNSGSYTTWWTRSPGTGWRNYNNWVAISSSGGSSSAMSPTGENGIAPFGVI